MRHGTCDTQHTTLAVAHLGTNRFAAPDVRPKVQRLARPTPVPLAVLFRVQQGFPQHLSLQRTKDTPRARTDAVERCALKTGVAMPRLLSPSPNI